MHLRRLMRMERSVPEKYEGLWRRRIIIRRDGTSDSTTDVWWFQSPSYSIDLRVPVSSTPGQKTAFAGVTIQSTSTEGEILEWRPDIAFPAISDEVDAGYVELNTPEELHERGLDGSYDEDWYKVENGEMTSSRSVDGDLFNFVIEGSIWKAVAKGRPTDSYFGHEEDQSKWTEVSVYRKSEDTSEWRLVASTIDQK